MAKRNFSGINAITGLNSLLNVDITFNTQKIDTRDHEGGVNIHAGCFHSDYVDGTYKFSITESDTVDGTYTNVPEEAIIADTSEYPFLKVLEVTAGVPAGQSMPYVQLKESKRFIRVDVTASATTTGSIILVLFNMLKDVVPVSTSGEIITVL